MRLKWLAPAALLAGTLAAAPGPPQDSAIPRYDHIFLIIEENQGGSLLAGPNAPALTKFANTYGRATKYYAVTHPSEPNYVALVGGATYRIFDDDAYYCKQGDKRPYCNLAWLPFFPNHTIDAPNIGTQLEAAGLSWKEYLESLPEPGSLVVTAADPKDPRGPPVYASKHSGFLNFTDVQQSAQRDQKIVDFDQLNADLRAAKLPNLAVIIPNLCNDMHGVQGNAPSDCLDSNTAVLIRRGDAHAKVLVDAIMLTKTWISHDRDAIVITFDEDEDGGKEGCCGISDLDPTNSGGGRVPLIVITNHGPRGVVDSTPYSHYSLLRTIEDAFGISSYLRHAGARGVVPMAGLFKDGP